MGKIGNGYSSYLLCQVFLVSSTAQRDCGRQFVESPQWKQREPDKSAMIDRLLLENIPLTLTKKNSIIASTSQAWAYEQPTATNLY